MKTSLAFVANNWHRLLPDTTQLLQCLALLVVAAGFIAIGAACRALVKDAKTLPEADLLVGWALVATVFTVLGTLTPISFIWLALAVAIAALAALALLIRHNLPLLPAGAAKLALLLVPILLATMSMLPAENDDLAQYLPNLRYLMVVNHFPGAGRPASDSALAAYPYTLAMVGYLAGKLSGTLADNAVNQFNLLLLGTQALLLIRLFHGPRETKSIGWGEAAVALVFVTLLAPTFVPKLVLSNYADCATSVALAFSAALAIRVLTERDPPGPGGLIQLCLCCAALILPKQANMVLFLLFAIGMAVAMARMPRRLPALPLVGLGAAVPYLVWRVQVAAMGGAGEQSVVPFAKWQFDVLPHTIGQIGIIVLNKGGYFAVAGLLCLVAAWALVRGPNPAERLTVVFATVFVGFTVFLLWVYVAVYIGYEGWSAASFWRYHTELGGLELAAAAALIGGWWHLAEGRRPALPFRLATLGCLVLALAGPIVGARFLRSDIHPVKDHMRAVAIEMATMVPAGATVLVVDANGSGLSPKLVDWYMGFGTQVHGEISAFTPAAAVGPTLANTTASYVYLLSWNEAIESALGQALPPGASHLLIRAGTGWAPVKSWRFDGFATPNDFKY